MIVPSAEDESEPAEKESLNLQFKNRACSSLSAVSTPKEPIPATAHQRQRPRTSYAPVGVSSKSSLLSPRTPAPSSVVPTHIIPCVSSTHHRSNLRRSECEPRHLIVSSMTHVTTSPNETTVRPTSGVSPWDQEIASVMGDGTSRFRSGLGLSVNSINGGHIAEVALDRTSPVSLLALTATTRPSTANGHTSVTTDGHTTRNTVRI